MSKEFLADRLTVTVFDTRAELGVTAARHIADAIARVLARKAECNVIFAAAPSQNETLAALRGAQGVDWRRVNAFHMDEYVGIAADAPQGFARFLKDRLFDHLPFGSVHLLDGNAEPEGECRRYEALLRAHPVDVVCLGIGENGHIAFNDPPVADFDDPLLVKVVTLDETCRLQQVHDGCFATLGDVPRQALTLTVPALLAGAELYAMVPAPTKARAVRDTLRGPVSTACPASVLRQHPAARLYLDRDSASLL